MDMDFNENVDVLKVENDPNVSENLDEKKVQLESYHRNNSIEMDGCSHVLEIEDNVDTCSMSKYDKKDLSLNKNDNSTENTLKIEIKDSNFCSSKNDDLDEAKYDKNNALEQNQINLNITNSKQSGNNNVRKKYACKYYTLKNMSYSKFVIEENGDKKLSEYGRFMALKIYRYFQKNSQVSLRIFRKNCFNYRFRPDIDELKKLIEYLEDNNYITYIQRYKFFVFIKEF